MSYFRPIQEFTQPTQEEILAMLRRDLAAELKPGRDDEAIAAWERMVPTSTTTVTQEAAEAEEA